MNLGERTQLHCELVNAVKSIRTYQDELLNRGKYRGYLKTEVPGMVQLDDACETMEWLIGRLTCMGDI